MNLEKKSVSLSGVAVLPVTVGARAFLVCGGQVIRTSRVVAVHEHSSEVLRFETMNSNYSVALTPSPLAAVSLIPMGMMAA